ELPNGWSSMDIGAVGVTGEASYLNGAFNLLASGSDIWETADAFHLASRTLTGDGVIVARIAAMQYTDPWAKAGLMWREGTDPGAKYVFLAIAGHGSSMMQWRTATGASTFSADGPEAKPPHWLKLMRRGDVFTGFVSADGTNWITSGSVTNALAETLSVGLALTAHNNAVLNSTLFQNVSVTAASSEKAEKSMNDSSRSEKF
ncbi:MAG TPA: hypothetical protein VF988_17305, partial [Verrucomicrobiae bacterium]